MNVPTPLLAPMVVWIFALPSLALADEDYELLAQADTSEQKTRVPPVEGSTESEARKQLLARGFTGKVTAYTTSAKTKCPHFKDSFLVGLVCATTPGFDDGNVSLSTDIALLIQGERVVEDPYGMPPNVIGMSRSDAVKLLADHRFTNVVYEFKDEPDCKAAQVCALSGSGPYWNAKGQWADNSHRLPLRETKLTLSIGTAYPRGDDKTASELTVINIVGETLNDALDKLDKAGIRGTVQRSPVGVCAPETKDIVGGRICFQDPPAGSKSTRSGIRYLIAKEKESLPSKSADDSPFSPDGDPSKGK